MNPFLHSQFAVIAPGLPALQVLITILPGLLFGLFTLIVSLFKPRVLTQGLQLVWRLKLPIAGIFAVCVSGIWAVRATWPSSTSAGSEIEIGAKDWPMYRGGLTRRGAVAGAVGPTRGGI